MRKKTAEHVLPWLYLVLIVISVATSMSIYAHWLDQRDQIQGLVQQNQQRIHENRKVISNIQASRVYSCRETYESFIEVFQPFLPRHKKDWTLKQRRDWARLIQIIHHLKRRCSVQTRPGLK